MRRFIFCILFLSCFIGAFATGQKGDVIFIEGQQWTLLGKPIDTDSALFFRLNEVLPENRVESTANWSGYTAYWSIKNGNLCLDSVLVDIHQECLPSDDLKSVFHDYYVNDNIIATWFNGNIRVAKGEVIFYIHQDFARNYEKEQIITIENGVTTQWKSYHNQEIVDGFYSYCIEKWVREKKLETMFPLHFESYPELAGCRNVLFEVKNIKVDHLGNLIDCDIWAWAYVSMKQEIEGLSKEMKEALMNIKPWKTLIIYDKVLPYDRYGITFPIRINE